MTGLEKMTGQIIDEAKDTAAAKLAAGKEEAGKILDQAKAAAAKYTEDAKKKSAAELAAYKEKVKSSIDFNRRTAILKAKQEMISSVLEKSYEAMSSMDDASYFELILKMVGEYAAAQEGSICFSKKDLERMPAGFTEKISQAAQKKGGSLTLSKESVKIENGFLLVYGGIEENCSFKAMMNSKKEELQDIINKELFS